MIISTFKWILAILISGLIGIPTLIFSFLLGKNIIHHASKLWGRVICFISGVEVELSGMENINRDGPQVFISNHQGFFDIFAITGFFNVSFLWIAKQSLFRIPVIGWAMSRAGHISIDRSHRKKSGLQLEKAIEEIKKGKSIVIFPEGTRTKDGRLGKFKKGSLFLAIKSQVPIVPVTIIGSYDILKKGEMRIKPGKIHIKIDTPFEADSLVQDSKIIILEKIRNIIEKNLEKGTLSA